jgi:hypothetical protein
MVPMMLAAMVLVADHASPAAADPPAKPKLICREGEQQTGSHVRSSRRCLTQDQWDQEDAKRVERPVTMRVIGEKSDAGARPQPQ